MKEFNDFLSKNGISEENTPYSEQRLLLKAFLAGMCAAISAARRGSRVVLVHDSPVLGGNCSSEIRMWPMGAGGSNRRETGIFEELF